MIKITNDCVEISGDEYEISAQTLALIKNLVKCDMAFNKILDIKIKEKRKNDADAKAHYKFIELLKDLKEIYKNEVRDDN